MTGLYLMSYLTSVLVWCFGACLALRGWRKRYFVRDSYATWLQVIGGLALMSGSITVEAYILRMGAR